MAGEFKYRGRVVTDADLDLIRGLISSFPHASRRALSRLLCEAWDWRQANGQLSDMVCRGLMLALHRADLIELPPVRLVAINNVVARRAPKPIAIDQTPLRTSLAELRPLEFRQVRRTTEEPLFNALLHQHHYLGYVQPVGEHLKFLVLAAGRPVACFAWSSPPRHLNLRDHFIGWSPQVRKRNLHYVAYNTRFLILPWVEVPHLASHLLGRMERMISVEWQRTYGHPIYYLETFVDPARFRGTCYRAANWIFLGRTAGRGNNAPTYRQTLPIKEVLGRPLSRRFREQLAGVR